MTEILTYYGTPVDELSREELLEAIHDLYRSEQILAKRLNDMNEMNRIRMSRR